MTARLRARVAGDDAGNAIVEFVYLAMLLMVPLVYLLLIVFRVQSAAYAVSGAAREAGRVLVTTPDDHDPQGRALAAASLVLSDSGLKLGADQLRITCSATPCQTPGATVEVVVSNNVSLPFVPRFLGESRSLVPVSSRHLEVVDTYRAPR